MSTTTPVRSAASIRALRSVSRKLIGPAVPVLCALCALVFDGPLSFPLSTSYQQQKAAQSAFTLKELRL
jgi:hypothetical protein